MQTNRPDVPQYTELTIDAIPTICGNMVTSIGFYLTLAGTTPTTKEKIKNAQHQLGCVSRLDPTAVSYVSDVFMGLVVLRHRITLVSNSCRATEDVSKGMGAVLFHVDRCQKAVQAYFDAHKELTIPGMEEVDLGDEGGPEEEIDMENYMAYVNQMTRRGK